MDQWLRASSMKMRALVRSVMVKELSGKEKLLIYWFIHVSTLTIGHKDHDCRNMILYTSSFLIGGQAQPYKVLSSGRSSE